MKSKLEFIGAMLIFGTIGLFRRMIPFPSSLIAATRGLIGTLFLLCFLTLTRQKLSFSTIRKNLIPLVLSGTLMGFNWILLFESYNYTSVAISTVCYYMAPVFVILSAPVFFKEKLTLKKIICAAVLYATVILINKKLTTIEAFDRTILQLGTSAVVLFPYTMMTENLSSLTFDGNVLILLLITGIVHTGIAYVLYFHSIKTLDTQSIAIYSYIDPMSAILFSALFLNETVTAIEMIGMVLILGSAFLSEIQKKS